jgi:hypothetical protein
MPGATSQGAAFSHGRENASVSKVASSLNGASFDYARFASSAQDDTERY